MIPRTLVPVGARLSAEDVATTRRRPTTLDERTLVPSGMPLVQLDGRSTIPSNLPLDSIAARVVVPRDVNVEAVQREEVSHLPPQPTEMDEAHQHSSRRGGTGRSLLRCRQFRKTWWSRISSSPAKRPLAASRVAGKADDGGPRNNGCVGGLSHSAGAAADFFAETFRATHPHERRGRDRAPPDDRARAPGRAGIAEAVAGPCAACGRAS